MRCKGCGKDLIGNDHHKVADWDFCPACFQHLMNPPDPEQRPEPGTACALCQAPIETETGKSIGIWQLCPACYGEMTRPAKPSTPKSDQNIVPDPNAPPRKRQETVDRTRTVSCSRCARTILEIGAKKEADTFFCPDCFYRKDPS